MGRIVRMDDERAPGRPWPIQLARFALVGVIGFLVDAGTLQAYLALLPETTTARRVSPARPFRRR
jgi:putative flippase GtrA